MEKVEERILQREKRDRIQKAILGTIALAGAVPLVLIAPGVIGALDKLGVIEIKKFAP